MGQCGGRKAGHVEEIADGSGSLTHHFLLDDKEGRCLLPDCGLQEVGLISSPVAAQEWQPCIKSIVETLRKERMTGNQWKIIVSKQQLTYTENTKEETHALSHTGFDLPKRSTS